MTGVHLRSDIDSIAPYVAGKAPAPHPAGSYKLSSNEFCFAPDDRVLAAAQAAMLRANRYPHLSGGPLVDRLAQHHSVPAENMVVGTGSASLLQQLVLAVTDHDDAVVYGWPSYEGYPIIVRVGGAVPCPVPLAGDTYDLPRVAEEIRVRHAPLAIVCNPNNPTGTAVDAAAFAEFLDLVPDDCLVVLDEAYFEFASGSALPGGLRGVIDRSNVACLRTFSKAHGLAGLRVGYCVAPTAVADAMRRVALPFATTAVGSAAAMAALDIWPEQQIRVREVVERRDWFVAGLFVTGEM